MLLIDIISASCPLLLCSIGALFSDYAGILAIFLEGLISFSAYLMYFYTTLTGSAFLGFILTNISAIASVFVFSLIIEKSKANPFIAATAINLFFSALPSFFSSITFGTRGVLYNENFIFNPFPTKIFTITLSALFIILSILFLKKTKTGLYIRITGSDSNVLLAKGVNPLYCRITTWLFAAFFASSAGALLTMRISSFVPNISAGRGWMALAAVYLGRKNPLRIIIAVVIFCAADFFAANIQNFIPQLPTAVLLSFPYFIVILMIAVGKK